jgi:hypothetical protein
LWIHIHQLHLWHQWNMRRWTVHNVHNPMWELTQLLHTRRLMRHSSVSTTRILSLKIVPNFKRCISPAWFTCWLLCKCVSVTVHQPDLVYLICLKYRWDDVNNNKKKTKFLKYSLYYIISILYIIMHILCKVESKELVALLDFYGREAGRFLVSAS